jgi:hypothetical protein
MMRKSQRNESARDCCTDIDKSELLARLERVEQIAEQQQETIDEQQETIEQQQETIDEQSDRIEELEEDRDRAAKQIAETKQKVHRVEESVKAVSSDDNSQHITTETPASSSMS